MAFLTAEQKKEQGFIHSGSGHAWMIRPEKENRKVGCGVEPAYRKVIRLAPLSSDGWDSLLLGKVQAFEYEKCASD
jgi:hypothetical protein